jgi:hypothetical protein
MRDGRKDARKRNRNVAYDSTFYPFGTKCLTLGEWAMLSSVQLFLTGFWLDVPDHNSVL